MIDLNIVPKICNVSTKEFKPETNLKGVQSDVAAVISLNSGTGGGYETSTSGHGPTITFGTPNGGRGINSITATSVSTSMPMTAKLSGVPSNSITNNNISNKSVSIVASSSIRSNSGKQGISSFSPIQEMSSSPVDKIGKVFMGSVESNQSKQSNQQQKKSRKETTEIVIEANSEGFGPNKSTTATTRGYTPGNGDTSNSNAAHAAHAVQLAKMQSLSMSENVNDEDDDDAQQIRIPSGNTTTGY